MLEATQTTSPNFPYAANYVEVRGSKIQYVDEGQGDPILFLHGNPTLSYLWRNIIPYLAIMGRVIGPDNSGQNNTYTKNRMRPTLLLADKLNVISRP